MNLATVFSDTATGIEITTNLVRFVQLRKSVGGVDIIGYGEREIPVESIEYSSSKDKVILETMKGLFADSKIKLKNVAVSISRSGTFFRRLTLPPVKDDVILPMIDNMASRHLPIRPSQAVWDFDLYEPDRKGTREVIFYGAKKDDVTEMINLLKKAGIRVVAIEPATLSSNTLNDEKDIPNGGEIVQLFVAEEVVHMSIFRTGRLLASRCIDLNPEELTKDTEGVVEKICKMLVAANRALDIIPGQDVLSGRVILSANENITGNLRTILEKALGIEVVSNHSPAWLRQTSGVDISKYGVPLGLAGGILRNEGLSINLLPPETKEKRRRDEITKTWILAGVNVILLVLLFATVSLQRGKELQGLRNEIESLEPRVRAAERIKREYENAVRVERSIGEIDRETTDWLNLLNDISAVLPEDAWLSRLEFEKGKPVLLAGMASSAAQLIPLLEDSPVLENASFEAPTTTTTVDGKQVENFRITATVLKGADESETDSER